MSRADLLDPLAPARTHEDVAAHPSARALEEHAFGAPGADRGGGGGASGGALDGDIGPHVQACVDCRCRVEQLRGERAAFLERRPARAFLAALSARRAAQDERKWFARAASWLARPFVYAPLGLAAVAAAVTLAVAPLERDAGRGSPAGVAFKGQGQAAARLEVLASRGGAPAEPVAGAALRAQDRLKLVVSTPRDGYLFVANVDSLGRCTRYYPGVGERSAPVAAGQRQVLPGTVRLDDFVGDERVVLLFSPEPLTETEVFAALVRAFERAGRRLDALDAAIDLRAEVSGVALRKVAP